jgi:16S rRNA G966 N2-methylase RsmD
MQPLDEFSIQFITENIDAKIEDLLLKNKGKQPTNIKYLAEQILARQKIKLKLPTWYKNLSLLFPQSISIEQSSSEITAQFKASLVSGDTLIDITGGMGIDFLAMSQKFRNAIYIEKNIELKQITEYNFKQLGISNSAFFNEDSINFLEKLPTKANWIYLDPARRNTVGQKVVLLENCEPNLLSISDLLFSKAENVLLKCSPMLDINLAIKQLKTVQKVHIIIVENEVKELLFQLNKTTEADIEISVVQFIKNKTVTFNFLQKEETDLAEKIGPVQKYLYEPNAGIMKAGAFKILTKKFNCYHLHPNTHLYTADNQIDNFPGRCFKIVNTLKASKEAIKKASLNKANLSIRNFPGNVDDLKKKLGIKDGGSDYLFACTNNLNEKIILHTTKIY